MKITGLQDLQSQKYISTQMSATNLRSAVRLSDDRTTLANTKALDASYAKLSADTKNLEKLQDPKSIKDAAAYTDSLKKLAADFNQASAAAKQSGGVEGGQAQRALKRVSDKLAAASGDTGLTVKKDGTLEVDEAAAKKAFSASADKAAAAFKGAAEKIDEAQPGIQSTIKAKTTRLEASIQKQTRAQLMMTDVTAQLSKTYDAQAGINTYSGPTSIYDLM